MKDWGPLDEALIRIDRLTRGIVEANEYLIESDRNGQACPDCRGVEKHFGACARQLAKDALRLALDCTAEA